MENVVRDRPFMTLGVVLFLCDRVYRGWPHTHATCSSQKFRKNSPPSRATGLIACRTCMHATLDTTINVRCLRESTNMRKYRTPLYKAEFYGRQFGDVRWSPLQLCELNCSCLPQTSRSGRASSRVFNNACFMPHAP